MPQRSKTKETANTNTKRRPIETYSPLEAKLVLTINLLTNILYTVQIHKHGGTEYRNKHNIHKHKQTQNIKIQVQQTESEQTLEIGAKCLRTKHQPHN